MDFACGAATLGSLGREVSANRITKPDEKQ